MEFAPADKRRVYLACRAIFTGDKAQLRQQKKVREELEKTPRLLRPLRDLGTDRVVDILRHLLKRRIFESELKIKVEFPELFNSSAEQEAHREASEIDAARSTAKALQDIASEDEGHTDTGDEAVNGHQLDGNGETTLGTAAVHVVNLLPTESNANNESPHTRFCKYLKLGDEARKDYLLHLVAFGSIAWVHKHHVHPSTFLVLRSTIGSRRQIRTDPLEPPLLSIGKYRVAVPSFNGSCKQRRASIPSQETIDRHILRQPPRKKQKYRHPHQPPPAFWDNLSEVPLTGRALEELNRRNTTSLSQTPASCPAPRRLAAKLTPQPAVEYLGQSTPSQLKQIKRFSREGGPDLSNLRGFSEASVSSERQVMSSSQSSLGQRQRASASPSNNSTSTSTHNTTTTKSTSPYDPAFQQHLIDYGIYPDGYEYPGDRGAPPQPTNMDEILQALARPRPSLSPFRFSDEEFRRFKRADAHAANEWQITSTVIPILEGDVRDTKWVFGQVPFTNLDHLTDGSLVPANPDRYYGARPEQLDRQVRAELHGSITPSTQHDLPIVPNFFLGAKGPEGSPAVAKRQASYDGALGARAMLSLQSYKASVPIYDNSAFTITSTYLDGALKMYTSHPVEPTTGAAPDYVTTQINSWSLTGNPSSFRTGASAYRNARDWAKLQRDEAIKRANARVTRAGVAEIS
ncbi:Uu.00g136320.m01.CDS01 [Anthostomella pinea]|uniref:Uu.00g136320.m01.CDS01 n=1 Tax=Anthostomella pinea TaxID=933095 RepID=A0AAI8VQH3_9PEZI|nr:Uu.00g136320.m01.CDS01 [Anthostomella pinea]